MKKIVSLLLAILMCLSAVSALAENGMVLQPANEQEYLNVESACKMGDTAYLIVNNGSKLSLYGWHEGDEEAAMFPGADTLVLAEQMIYASLDDGEAFKSMTDSMREGGLDPDHAVSKLFTDGERLMSLNTVTGLVFEIKVTETGLAFEDIVTLKDMSAFLHIEEDWGYQRTNTGAAVVDGKLYWGISDWDQLGVPVQQLLVADLTTGEVTVSGVEFVQQVTAAADGKLLTVNRDDANAMAEDGSVKKPVLNLYDPATDTLTPIGEIDVAYGVGNLAYFEKMDAAIYAMNGRIMAMPLKGGQARQVGFFTGEVNSSTPVVIMGNTALIMTWTGLMARPVNEKFSADVYLNVFGGWADAGRILFSQRYPDVPVYDCYDYFDDLQAFTQSMVSGGDSLDVLTVSVDYSVFITLRDKGYCADLSAYPEIVSAVERMHPCFRDLVTVNGKVVGIPVNVYSSGWYVSNMAMEMMGLTIDDIPADIVGLCAFINRFNDEMAEQYEEVTLFDMGVDSEAGLKELLRRTAMDMYVGWCMAEGRELAFNTPEFRAVMAAIDGLHTDHLKFNNFEEDRYLTGLFETGYQVVGDFSGWTLNYSTFLPLTLTADTNFWTGVSVDVMFINPNTRNMDAAVNLLTCKLEALDDTTAHILFVDATEPVENPSYEDWLNSEEEYMNSLREQIASSEGVEREELEMMLTAEEEYVAQNMERSRYLISASAIEHYQTYLLPHMYVAEPSIFNSSDEGGSELDSLLRRYADGQITLDQFISEADNKLFMIRMENQ